MSSSTPIQPGASWVEQWHIQTYTGADEDLTDAELAFVLEDLGGTELLDLNDTDNPASFSLVDSNGDVSVTGPYVRVTLDDTQTGTLSQGRARHQLTVTLSTGVVVKSDVIPVIVEEVL